MKRRLCYVIGMTVLAFCSLIAPASATHVQCGATITQDTTLDSDIQCGPNQETGLIIGASDVTLRMAGHKLTAGLAGAEGLGIRTVGSQPLARVHIRRGTVSGFSGGVVIFADDTSVRKLNVDATTLGIQVIGNGAYAYRNVVDITTPPTPINGNSPGIHLWGDDPYAWGNVVKGWPFQGVLAEGDRARVVLNEIQSCDDYGSGIYVVEYTTYAVVNRNTIAGCYEGIVAIDQDGGGGARIRLNQTAGGLWGLRVDDPSAILGRNTATGATWDGIFLEKAGTTVQNNTANDNDRYGINGPVGTIDAGGNTASGNGNGTTPQCVNVQCGSP